MTKILNKTFKNKGGDILVRSGGCGIVEILHLWNNNKSGCTIGYWEERESDGEPIAEFRSCSSRIMETEYDGVELIDILKFGQKFADFLIELRT